MASFVDVSIKEGRFQQELADLIKSKSTEWKIGRVFYRIVYPATSGTIIGVVPVAIARHYIMESTALPGIKFGMATVGKLSLANGIGDCPTESQPKRSGTNEGATPTDEKPFIDWVKSKVAALEPTADSNKATRFFDSSTVYFYMCEQYPAAVPEASGTEATAQWTMMYSSYGDETKFTLDIENWFYKIENNAVTLLKPELQVMQSPISRAVLHYDGEPVADYYNETYKVEQAGTNWWFDSLVSVKGSIDKQGFLLTLASDAAPAWEDNIVPIIPLHFGLVEPFKDDAGNYMNYKAVAMFTGSCPCYLNPTSPFTITPVTGVSAVDFDDPKVKAPTILPVLKTYPRHASNGVDTVMVWRGTKGARYQEHFLSWSTAPNKMPPDRSDTHDTAFSGEVARDYPRAWNQPLTEEYSYRFNPSRYSNKVHTSKVYLVHPEEGVVGALRNAIGMSPIGVSGGKVKVLKDPCNVAGGSYENFRYMVVEGQSPLTKRPGTPYRPCGLGISETPSELTLS